MHVVYHVRTLLLNEPPKLPSTVRHTQRLAVVPRSKLRSGVPAPACALIAKSDDAHNVPA